MMRHAALLSLAVFLAFAAAQTSASAMTPTLLAARTHEPGPQAQSLRSAQPAASATGSAKPSDLFTVKDEKGLLLTCIAPKIDTDTQSDVFKSCTLAPGRNLDDVMHTFVQAIHYEQDQHQKERDKWLKYLEENAAQKPAK